MMNLSDREVSILVIEDWKTQLLAGNGKPVVMLGVATVENQPSVAIMLNPGIAQADVIKTLKFALNALMQHANRTQSGIIKSASDEKP